MKRVRICQTCGTPFFPGHARQLFCTTHCYKHYQSSTRRRVLDEDVCTPQEKAKAMRTSNFKSGSERMEAALLQYHGSEVD